MDPPRTSYRVIYRVIYWVNRDPIKTHPYTHPFILDPKFCGYKYTKIHTKNHPPAAPADDNKTQIRHYRSLPNAHI